MLFVILSRVPFDRSKAESPEAPAVILKANTIGSDAEATPNPFCPCFLLYGRGGGQGGRESPHRWSWRTAVWKRSNWQNKLRQCLAQSLHYIGVELLCCQCSPHVSLRPGKSPTGHGLDSFVSKFRHELFRTIDLHQEYGLFWLSALILARVSRRVVQFFRYVDAELASF